MYGHSSASSNSSYPIDISLLSQPSGITRWTDHEGNWLECDSEALVLAALKASVGNIRSTHPIKLWQDAASLPADAVVSENVNSSGSATSITVTVGNEGELTLAPNGSPVVTLRVDLKHALVMFVRDAHRAMRNYDDATATSWKSLYNTLRDDSGFWEL